MNIANQLKETLLYLSEFRKGFKYSLTISQTKTGWVVSVTGTSTEDKSLPFDFVQCSSDNFNELPFLIKNKAKELIQKEIEANALRINELEKQTEKLKLQIKLNNDLRFN